MKTQKINLIITLFCQLAIGQSISKQVIGSSGMTQANSSHKLSWTVGEPIVGLMTAGGNQLGNGFYTSLDITALSTEEFSMDVAIKIYPNPSSHLLYASQKEQHPIEIKVIDLSGKLLLTKKISDGEAIDISLYTNGMYLIEALDKVTNKKNTYKIIKK